jgi:hypothetical protein
MLANSLNSRQQNIQNESAKSDANSKELVKRTICTWNPFLPRLNINIESDVIGDDRSRDLEALKTKVGRR